jgi:hypothetical protein
MDGDDDAPRSWTSDARFWGTVFIVLFWPAVMLWHLVGCAVLLAIVLGAWYGFRARERRGSHAG